MLSATEKNHQGRGKGVPWIKGWKECCNLQWEAGRVRKVCVKKCHLNKDQKTVMVWAAEIWEESPLERRKNSSTTSEVGVCLGCSFFFSFYILFICLTVLCLSYSMLDLPSSLHRGGSLAAAFQTLSCSLRDLVPWLGIKPSPLALGGKSLRCSKSNRKASAGQVKWTREWVVGKRLQGPSHSSFSL